ncbi:MAG: hypothetical protein V7K26_00065 [Nostoc sp.]|uniref:hypothetical protein n=1 Tax=Nostoc sp. TaxID=1180 RepID=UPI002FF3C85C
MYCQGASKGIVFFTDKGIDKKIEVSKTPFNVSCNPVDERGRSGKAIYTYDCSNPIPQCQNQTREIALYEHESLFFKSVLDNAGYDGNHYDLYANSVQGERLLLAGFSTGCGLPTISNKKFIPNGNDGLVVKDSANNNMYIVAVSECKYSVSCDKDCPEDSHKCIHKQYPGYCCVPCKKTGDRLKNIANKVGQ